MKKLKILISIFTIMIMIFSCEDDVIVDDELVDVSWLVGAEDFTIKVGDFISFQDISRGELTHTWTIEEGSNYLSNNYVRGDKDLTPFIIEEKPLTTTDKTIHVLFNTPGTRKVVLRNTFDRKVTFRGEIPIEAFQEGDVWVIEKVFEIEVLGELQPAFSVFDAMHNEILNVTALDEVNSDDSDTWPTVNLTVGETLRFVDNTNGSDNREWAFNNGDIIENSTDMEVVVTYNTPGSGLAGAIGVSRETPSSDAKKLIPLRIVVTN